MLWDGVSAEGAGAQPPALWGRDEAAEQTLLHELGHHESWLQGTEHSSYETGGQQAREEAFADKFAVTHFRRDPRNQGPYDPREHTYMARGSAAHFGQYAGAYWRAFPKDMYPPEKNHNVGQQFHQPELDATQPLGRTGELSWGGGPKWPDVFIGKDIEKPRPPIRNW